LARRVLLGCNSPQELASGVAGTVLEIGAGLEQLGWDPTFAFLGGGLPNRLRRQLFYFELAAKARFMKPDVAIISSGDGALIPLLASSTPLVMQSHGLERLSHIAATQYGLADTYGGRGHLLIREPAIRAAMGKARMVVVKTSEERDYIVDMMGHPPEKITILPNGVPDDFFTIQRSEASRPTVVWVSSWIPRKGTGWLPEIMEAVAAAIPEVEFRLLGTGIPNDELLRRLPNNLTHSVLAKQFVTRAELRDHLGASWVGLFTSAYEGFGKVVPEMMAAGMPVVSTSVGVSPELLSRGETGRLVKWGDAPEAANALTAHLSDDVARRASGAAARDAVEHLRWPNVVRQWDDLLDTIIPSSS